MNRDAVCGTGLLLVAMATASCATYTDELGRAQRAYSAGEYEHSIEVLRALERDRGYLGVTEDAPYAYLRGMSALRLGYAPDARHWLSLADSMEKAKPGSLGDARKKLLAAALDKLNEQVYAHGIRSLENKRPAEDEPQPRTKPAGSSDSKAKAEP